MESEEDAVLVSGVAAGDERALAVLYDRHGRAAYGVAVRVLGDPHLAEDAVQDAFLALWRSAASYDRRRAAVSTWIHVLVHRRAVDLVRREERRRTGDGRVDEHPPAPAPEEAALTREARDRARAALAQLSSQHRAVLELAYYGGLTQSEVATRLGVPLGTVKSRTWAALARLGDLLAEPGDGPAVPGTRSGAPAPVGGTR